MAPPPQDILDAVEKEMETFGDPTGRFSEFCKLLHKHNPHLYSHCYDMDYPSYTRYKRLLARTIKYAVHERRAQNPDACKEAITNLANKCKQLMDANKESIKRVDDGMTTNRAMLNSLMNDSNDSDIRACVVRLGDDLIKSKQEIEELRAELNSLKKGSKA